MGQSYDCPDVKDFTVVLPDYIRYPHVQRVADKAYRFQRKIRPSRLDAAEVRTLDVASVRHLLHGQPFAAPYILDSFRNVVDLNLIIYHLSKKIVKRFCNAKFCLYICTMRIIYDTEKCA